MRYVKKVYLQEVGEVQLIVELEPVVDLDVRVGHGVVLETHEVEVQHRGELVKLHALDGVLHAQGAGVVTVLALQRLGFDVVLERLVDWAKERREMSRS